MNRARWTRVVCVTALLAFAAVPLALASAAVADPSVQSTATVANGAELRQQWGIINNTVITLTADIQFGSGLDDNCADPYRGVGGSGIVIDGQGLYGIEQTCDFTRVLLDEGVEHVTLTGLTHFTGGQACGAGGGLYTNGAATVENSLINGNVASGTAACASSAAVGAQAIETDPVGGGIYSDVGGVDVVRSSIQSNHADLAGGGVASVSGATVTESTFVANSTGVSGAGATYEGGGLAALSDVTVTGSAFELNFIGDSGGVCSGCQAYGGGVFAAGTVAVTATTFLANRADCGAECSGVGGGIMAISDVGIVGGSFAGNSASCQAVCDLVGGGVFSPAISVAASSFDGNHVDCVEFCDNVGGGFTSGTIEVSDSSMTNNTARCEAGCQAQGGGFFGGGPVQNGAQSYASGVAAAGPGWGGARVDATALVPGAVAIDHSAFSGNVASCSTGACGGSGGSGGGFFSGDPTAVDIHSSTFDHNTAFYAGGAADVEARANPPVSVVNSTITQNSSGSGGALTLHAGPATIAYDTIVQNIVTNPVAAVAVPTVPANLTASNPVFFGTIIALPVGGPNCVVSGASSQGYNFSDDATCGLDQATDHVATPNDPGLGALGSNGGPTQTMLPQTGSPVIDAIPVAACQTGGAAGITVDQRGVTRPQGPGCDIGAVEVEFVVPTPTPSPAVIITPKFTG